MKVLFLGSGMLPIPPPGWGAVEKAIFELSRALPTVGVETEIVNVPGSGRSIDEYRFALRLRGLLQGRTWDILHASTPVVANRLSSMKWPYVYTSHSRHWSGASGPTERWGFFLERRAVRRAVRTIALTAAVAEKMRSGPLRDHPETLMVVPNGVDTRAYTPAWEQRNGNRILGVGAVHPRKRWHVATRAIQGLPETRLTIVGPIQDPSYARTLRRSLPDGRLELLGEVPEDTLRSLYSVADQFVLPSRSELMSMAVIEAMASGVPIIGTEALTGTVESGTEGYLWRNVPEGEEVREAQRILELLLGDPGLRRRLGEAARAKAVRDWDWSVIARRMRELYESIPPQARTRKP